MPVERALPQLAGVNKIKELCYATAGNSATFPCQCAADKGSVDKLLLRLIHLGLEPTKPDIAMHLEMFLLD
jgi:hypothetical protein